MTVIDIIFSRVSIPTVGGYGRSQMESHGAVGLSVCLSVGRSVGRNQ